MANDEGVAELREHARLRARPRSFVLVADHAALG
jgi:hypothetical protein